VRKETITAALLVIGDRILSGRTKDQNIGYVAEYLTALGMHLAEVRVVSNEETAIVDAVNALRHRYTYVFITGGIGPTHDDITADSVARSECRLTSIRARLKRIGISTPRWPAQRSTCTFTVVLFLVHQS
jgi:molybdopterin-biosynthesis enzyme MoeA-like protein